MSKNCQKLDIFSKKLTKIVIFCQFFFDKKGQVFGNFLTFKWQFSGESDSHVCRASRSWKNNIEILYRILSATWLTVGNNNSIIIKSKYKLYYAQKCPEFFHAFVLMVYVCSA